MNYTPIVIDTIAGADIGCAHTGTSLTGEGEICNTLPVYENSMAISQRPPSVTLDTLSINAKHIVDTMRSLTATIKRQTEDKDALLARVKSFTGGVSKFKDAQHKLISIIFGEIPENKELLELLLESRMNTEKVLEQIDSVINANLQKKISVLNEHLEYNYQNRAELIKFMSESVRSVRELNGELNKPNTCGVCYDKEVNTCLVPCGHTFCGNCTENMKDTCAMCSGKVERSVRMFLSI